MLSVFVVYEGVAIWIITFAWIKWKNMSECKSTSLFQVLFGIMNLSLFIIGRAVITFIMIVSLASYRLVWYLNELCKAKKRKKKIKNLKLIKYSSIHNIQNFNKHIEIEWNIWMEPFKDNDNWIWLPWSGDHYFHKQWISNWLVIKPICPYDREIIIL